MPTIRTLIHQGDDYRAAVSLRDRILRAPLGLSFSEDELEAEHGDFHLGAFDDKDGTLIGCLVLSPQPEHALKMRQVAIAESHRGQGIGMALVNFAEALAQSRGFDRIILNARESVVPFYERLHYQVIGEPFIEVNLPHRRMSKALTPLPLEKPLP